MAETSNGDYGCETSPTRKETSPTRKALSVNTARSRSFEVGYDDLLSPKSLYSSTKGATAPGAFNIFEEFKIGKKQLFVDQEKMKQQLRDKLAKPMYDVTDLYHTSGRAQSIARHQAFEVLTLVVIGFNALWISIDTDLNHAETLLTADWPFIVAENIFCTYFFFEWVVRFLSFKRKRDGLRDAWFVFDSALVLLMVVETWIMTAVLLATGSTGSGALGNASMLRMARLLRLTRMARMARLMRSMPELMILIHGMVAATRSVVFTLILLLAIMYIFAIAFTQLSSGTDIGEEYFSTVPNSMQSLLIHGTFMDDLAGVALSLSAKMPALLPLFYVYVLLASLTLMNMLIGVLCEVVTAVANTEKESMTIAYVRDVLHQILHQTELDTNNDGKICKKEFMGLFEDKMAIGLLEDIGVDVVGLCGYADFIFESDEDDEEITLGYDDLLKLILDIRGSNAATVRDVVDLRKFVKQQITTLDQKAEARFIRSPRNSGQRPSLAQQRSSRKSSKSSLDFPGLGATPELAPPVPDFPLPTRVITHAVPTEPDLYKDAEALLERMSQPASKALAAHGELNLETLIASHNGRTFSKGSASNFETLAASHNGRTSSKGSASPPGDSATDKDVKLEAVIAPIALNFKKLTRDLVAGVQVLQQQDQIFAELRSENHRLMSELMVQTSASKLPTIPGVPDHQESKTTNATVFFKRNSEV